MQRSAFVLLLALSVTTGCVTPYQPMGARGGYMDTEVQPGIFEIVVSGNALTNVKTLEGYFHRPATEICSWRGFRTYDFRLNASVTRSPSSYTASTWRGTTTVTEQQGYTRGQIVGVIACMEPVKK